jgi:dihydroorotase, multifunctional complex type
LKTLIKNGIIVNEGLSFKGSLFVDGDKIAAITSDASESDILERRADRVLDIEGLHLLPGVIDDQVHFRFPGATHKATIASESAAAALGGVTSFMDMPNNNPPATSSASLQNKVEVAARESYVNYSFYLGADNTNISEIENVDVRRVCGVKVFMGSSTGNMLVDNDEALSAIFSRSPILVATHCEQENIIRANLAAAVEKYGDDIPVSMHPSIRSREACIASTKKAISLAAENGTKLHVLHVSTAEEVELIREARKTGLDVSGEICVHYLCFCDEDYQRLGTLIKCNPAIKSRSDREALRRAVAEGVISVVATDHAPHLLSEKQNVYTKAPSGLPLVQTSLQAMLELSKEGLFTVADVVDRMSHSPARRFEISRRGFLREGCFADLAVVDLNRQCTVQPAYKCGWSPFEGFSSTIVHTFVNGEQVVSDGVLLPFSGAGDQLTFDR